MAGSVGLLGPFDFTVEWSQLGVFLMDHGGFGRGIPVVMIPWVEFVALIAAHLRRRREAELPEMVELIRRDCSGSFQDLARQVGFFEDQHGAFKIQGPDQILKFGGGVRFWQPSPEELHSQGRNRRTAPWKRSRHQYCISSSAALQASESLCRLLLVARDARQSSHDQSGR